MHSLRDVRSVDAMSVCYGGCSPTLQTLQQAVPRPILAQIDVAAMRHNLAAARTRAGDRRIWAIVKANAYGHGIEHAVRGFEAADGLGLIDLPEAAVPPVFDCLTDRTYGQTRIMLWTPKNPALPSTPEPSIP